MTMFSDIIKTHVRGMVKTGKWNDLFRYLDHLSNSNFKSAKFILENDVLLLASSRDFWETSVRLVEYRPKAFLNSVAKVARNRRARGNWKPDFDYLKHIAELLSGEEARPARYRFIRFLLPLFSTEPDIDRLFAAFGVNAPAGRIVLLREVSQPIHYFMLFNLLRSQDDHALTVDCCRFLIKQGDDLSYNMASLLKSYFDLKEVKGVFSLQLQPYELGYLENSFSTFERTIRKI